MRINVSDSGKVYIRTISRGQFKSKLYTAYLENINQNVSYLYELLFFHVFPMLFPETLNFYEYTERKVLDVEHKSNAQITHFIPP